MKNENPSYRDLIEIMTAQMNRAEDWGMELEGPEMEFFIDRVNEILNEPQIEERSAAEWDALIMEGGDDSVPLQVAQSILEL